MLVEFNYKKKDAKNLKQHTLVRDIKSLNELNSIMKELNSNSQNYDIYWQIKGE